MYGIKVLVDGEWMGWFDYNDKTDAQQAVTDWMSEADEIILDDGKKQVHWVRK